MTFTTGSADFLTRRLPLIKFTRRSVLWGFPRKDHFEFPRQRGSSVRVVTSLFSAQHETTLNGSPFHGFRFHCLLLNLKILTIPVNKTSHPFANRSVRLKADRLDK